MSGGWSFIARGGVVGESLRSRDWRSSSLGAPGSWSPEFRAVVQLCVEGRFPSLVYWGPDLLMIYNDALIPLIGEDRHPESLGRPAFEVLPELGGQLEPIMERVLSEGESFWTEDMMLPIVRGGRASESYYTFAYTPIRTGEGEVAGIHCSVVETTEQTIEQRRLRLLSALNDATGASTVAEAAARVALVIAQDPGDVPFALIYVTDADGVAATLHETVGLVSAMEPPDRWRLDDGFPWSETDDGERVVPVGAESRRAVLLPLSRDEDGDPLAFLVAGISELGRRDEAERRFHSLLATHVCRCLANALDREAEQTKIDALLERDEIKSSFFERQRRREDPYRNLMQAPFPVAVLRGPEHVVELANPHILQTWGKPATVVGLPLLRALPELEGQPFIGYLDQVRATGVAYEGRAELARLAREPGGELEDCYFNFVYSPLTDYQGTVTGILIAAFDVTENVEARAVSEAARSAAEAAERAQRQLSEFQERFVAVLGHDLRGPLGAITMGAGLLSKRAETDGDALGERVLSRVQSSTRRMSRMVDQLLDLARSRLGEGLPIEPVSMDLAELLTRIRAEVRASHPTREFAMRGDSIVGTWDEDRLEQVFSNLIANAANHGADGTTVSIELSESADDVRVLVHNHGAPIPKSIIDTIFDPFRRGERESRGANASGLGLGLYISHEIVRAHGGTIGVQSSEAEGTTFSVTLPRHANSSP